MRKYTAHLCTKGPEEATDACGALHHSCRPPSVAGKDKAGHLSVVPHCLCSPICCTCSPAVSSISSRQLAGWLPIQNTPRPAPQEQARQPELHTLLLAAHSQAMTPWKLPRGRPQGGGRRLAALAAAITTALTLGALLSRYSSATPRRMLLPCCLLNGSAGGGPSWQPPEQRGKERPAVEVVVSHYSASLGWLAAFLSSLPNNTQLTIYSKGPHPPIGTTP